MSAIVCGKRSNLFGDFQSSLSSPYVPPPVSKRIRHTFSPARSNSDSDHLVERALEESGDDLDSTIKRLNELRLGSGDNLGPVAGSSGATHESSSQVFTEDALQLTDLSSAKVVHLQGTVWVDLFVGEIKIRASRALEAFEKAICARATETACGFQKENMTPKQQFEALIQENAILKRAVAIQHERQKEFEDRGNELNQLKQLVAQY
ncbi:hypothetical protein H5410_022063 [Solanum commersonii]|uniref:Uncharacterized protein n=1 Tax=Solanum commersonii TaxID=4109 RepID=A0A9J5ZIQ0_SOLCO|nr:hypothetical protein H5410_022063 [Solanum commersonii]